MVKFDNSKTIRSSLITSQLIKLEMKWIKLDGCLHDNHRPSNHAAKQIIWFRNYIFVQNMYENV